MFKNRFVLIAVLFSLLLVTAAVAGSVSSTSESADPNWSARPIILPVTGNSEFPDYFLRHPEVRRGFAKPVVSTLHRVPPDECFDVPISELAACREAEQSPAP